MDFTDFKARQRLAWGLDVDAYVRHTLPELAPVAEQLVEVADPAWGARVLDVGCGPGTATLRAARRVGPGGHATGVDLAPPMLAHAERAAARDGLGNVAFLEVDGESLDGLPDASFDVVLSNFGAIFAPRPRACVEAMARVLRPGGVVAMSFWRPVGAVRELLDFLAGVLPPPPEGAASSESWGLPGVAEERLAPHFEQLTVREVNVLCDYASVEDAWVRMKEGRPPFALAYGRMSFAERKRVEDEARALFRRQADETGRVQYVRAAAIIRGVRRA